MRRLLRAGLFVLGLASLVTLGCRVTSLPIWRPVEAAISPVEEVRDISYVPEEKLFRHSLDLFYPKDQANYPVVILVHGGAWVIGDNRCCGLYSSIGKFLAGHGIGVVIPNYRLSPWNKHPEHVRDVARAVAWTIAHIADYGGCPNEIFLAGHSAGGHLVSLLATDPSYLEAEKVAAVNIQGVVSVSGVYDIPPGKMEFTLGGDTPRAFRINEVAPVRRNVMRDRLLPVALPGIPMSIDLFGLVFGEDPEVRAAASPLTHVRPGLPPFLIISAEKDLPTLLEMAVGFHQALTEKGCKSRFMRIPDRNHNTVMFRAIEKEDPVASAIIKFVRMGKP